MRFPCGKSTCGKSNNTFLTQLAFPLLFLPGDCFSPLAGVQRRKKREAERRWKKYFETNAMDALNVLNKAKEAEAVSGKFKRPLAGDAAAAASAGEPGAAQVSLAGGESEVPGAASGDAAVSR